jgi:hypothetical protein
VYFVAAVVADPAAMVESTNTDAVFFWHQVGESPDFVPLGERGHGKARAKVGVLNGLPLWGARSRWVPGPTLVDGGGTVAIGEDGADKVPGALQSKVLLERVETEQKGFDGFHVVGIGAGGDVFLHTYVNGCQEAFIEAVVLRCQSFDRGHRRGREDLFCKGRESGVDGTPSP